MKSIILVGVSIILVAFLSSCRKDFTCTCSKIYKNETGKNLRNFSVKTYRDSRNGAEEKCKGQSAKGIDDTGSYSLACHIEC